MKRVTAAALLFLPAIVLTAQTPSTQAPQPLTGRWLITSDYFGTTRYLRLDLEQKTDQKPEQLTGTLNGTQLKGCVTGSHLALTGTSSDGGTSTSQPACSSNLTVAKPICGRNMSARQVTRSPTRTRAVMTICAACAAGSVAGPESFCGAQWRRAHRLPCASAP